MSWNILLFKSKGFKYVGPAWKKTYRRVYECQVCKAEVTSSQRASHGRRHERAGEAVPVNGYTYRNRLEWNIKTDDPALEAEYPRYYYNRIPKVEPTVAAVLTKAGG